MFFRKAFSRSFTWLVFCMLILGFIGTHEMGGVTSFCRFWGLEKRVKYLAEYFYL